MSCLSSRFQVISSAIAVLVMIAFMPITATAQDNEPPRADEFEATTNFLACRGNGYALCYYSGPTGHQPTRPGTTAPSLPCNPAGPAAAACVCYALPGGVYESELTWNYVEVGSILNPQVRSETMEQCEEDGSNCLNMVNLHGICRTAEGVIAEAEECQEAPVCSYLGNAEAGIPQTLYPEREDVTLISTFSFAYSDVHMLGSHDCTDTPYHQYAGCMTAPCTQDEDGLTTCECPLYEGPYQVGQDYSALQCNISPNVWSAAYHDTDGTNTPAPDGGVGMEDGDR